MSDFGARLVAVLEPGKLPTNNANFGQRNFHNLAYSVNQIQVYPNRPIRSNSSIAGPI